MSQGQNSDTTYTKIFVGGLPWATRDEDLKSFFEQFGEIIHVNVVCDKQTNRSKGYGFVTFKEAESATKACEDPKPIIEGRKANCNLASEGRNTNRNQSNITGFRHDDLCYLSQSYMQSQQQQQLGPTSAQPHGNNYSQVYNTQSQCYPQPQFVQQDNPHVQYDPQLALYGYYYPFVVDNNAPYWPDHYMGM